MREDLFNVEEFCGGPWQEWTQPNIYTDCIGILMPENDVTRNADWLVVTADLRPPFVISDAWHTMR